MQTRITGLCLILGVLLCRGAVAATPGELSYSLFLHEGYRSLADGDYIHARDYFTQACNLDVRAVESRFALADVLMALGQNGEAVIQMRHGLHLDSHWPSRDQSRYGLFGKPGELDRMLDSLRRQVSQLPHDWACRVVLAYNLYYMGELVDAYELFSEANQILHGDRLCTRYMAAIKERGFTPPKKEGEAAEDAKKAADKEKTAAPPPDLPRAPIPVGPGALVPPADAGPGAVQFGPPNPGQ